MDVVSSAMTWPRRVPRVVRGFHSGPHDSYNALTQVFERPPLRAGPLHDWSVSIKENIAMKGVRTTCASRILAEYRAPFDATVVERLRDAGAWISSRNNCDEFAMGALNTHSMYGPVANPAYPLQAPRAPGGSSGGAAAAVAAGLCRLALGTDTGGSVRIPASYCGVYGFKPSYGMLSRWGVVSYADSLDTVGILARELPDIARAFDVLAADDPRDATCVPNDVRQRLSHVAIPSLPGLRVGVVQELFPAEVDARTLDAVDGVLESMASQGATIVPTSVPLVTSTAAVYYLLSLAEASSNLARYDGIRFGVPAQRTSAFFDDVARHRSRHLGAEVQRRLLLGTYAVSSEARRSHYTRALRLRQALREAYDACFRDVDVLVYPTTLGVAPRLDEPAEEYASDVLAVSANLAGFPAISVPVRGRDPIGVSFAMPWGHDRALLSLLAQLRR